MLTPSWVQIISCLLLLGSTGDAISRSTTNASQNMILMSLGLFCMCPRNIFSPPEKNEISKNRGTYGHKVTKSIYILCRSQRDKIYWCTAHSFREKFDSLVCIIFYVSHDVSHNFKWKNDTNAFKNRWNPTKHVQPLFLWYVW